MLFATDIIRTLVGSGTSNRFALVLIIAFKMLGTITPERNITLNVPRTRNDETRWSTIGCAFRMALTRNEIGALVSPTTINRDTLIASVTGEMLWATAENGITSILAWAGNRNASSIVCRALRMLAARDKRGAFICARAVDRKALRPLAHRMLRITTSAEEQITFVIPFSRHRDTRVTIALRMFGTRRNGCTGVLRTIIGRSL